MNTKSVDAIANAVLYEGYMLYPYRPSSVKNRQRFNFGVLYPRAGCLSGCTAHNAMMTVYPHNDDWRYLETLTGDSSWSPDNMRRYFQRRRP